MGVPRTADSWCTGKESTEMTTLPCSKSEGSLFHLQLQTLQGIVFKVKTTGMGRYVYAVRWLEN